MKHNYYFIFLLLICQTVKAQVITQKVSENSMRGPVFEVPFSIVPKYSQPDLKKTLKEDIASSELPERIGIGLEANIDIKQEKCTYRNEGKVWAVKLEAENSKFLSLFFDDLYLPKGSELYIFNRKNQIVIGPFDYTNTSESHTFQTGLIKGEDIIVALIENPSIANKSRVHLKTLFYGYKESSDEFAFGSAAVCNTNENANCASGASVSQQTDAVAMILKNSNGDLRICSATLLNNACQNLKPSILTAFHCVDSQ